MSPTPISGGYHFRCCDNFIGTIDEVKIYSVALSAEEILSRYQAVPKADCTTCG